MASLSAAGVRSPYFVSQQQHSHHPNGTYTVAPYTASSITVAHNVLHHHRQCSTSSSCTTFTLASESNYGEGDNVSLLSYSSNYPYVCNSKTVRESEFSSPTSWEFRDNCSQNRLSSGQNHQQVSSIRMPSTAASASSPMVLPLSLPPQASSSSGGSSVSTTPSPLEEIGPGTSSSYYPFPMQLSLLRSNGSLPSAQAVLSVRNVSNSGNCSCVALANSSHSKMVVNDVGGGGGCGPEELLLNSHDLTNGNGSDGSRNSTGSHRSQDSGFSDSGETRRRKSSSNGGSVIISSQVVAGMTFEGSQAGTHGVNGSVNHNHYLHPTQQNSINGHFQQQMLCNGNSMANYECANGTNSNCCGSSSRPMSPHVLNAYGSFTPILNHAHLCNNPQSNHIYDRISSPSMPSPIPSSGFGCGRLMASANAHVQQNNGEGSMYGTVLSRKPTPPRRPASVDISTMNSNGSSMHGLNGIISRRRSPSPSSPAATAACTNCLNTSINFHNQQQSHQRRSFSPSGCHDISALASSSTATAMAALQVPLSSSTPKRVSNLSSSSRLIGNGNANMVKIDNFETLNKNINKDNNNNSSGNCSNSSNTSNTPTGSGKKGNKTFTIHSVPNTHNNKDSVTRVPSASNSASNSNANGTVLCEEESRFRDRRNDSSNSREVAKQSKQSGGLSTSKGKTAAESIYDKICSRLSSFSSSTSSSTAASPPSSIATEDQTVVVFQKSKCTNNNKILASLPSPLREEPSTDGSLGPLLSDTSSQSSNNKVSNDSKSIQTNEERKPFERNLSATSSMASTSSASKFKSIQASNYTQKSLSLPRGHNSKGLSIFEDVGCEIDIQSEAEPLPESSEYSATTQTSPTPAWKAVEQQADSQVVRLWLHDLRTQIEPECLHSLQTKWIVPADYSQDEEDELESEDISRSATETRSVSPATSSTITVGRYASTTTGGHGRISSSSSASSSSTFSHPLRHSHYTTTSHNSKSTTPTSEDYVIGPMVSTSLRFIQSNSKHHVKPTSSTSYVAKHRQRRSQQKFLSSMTAAIHAVSTPLMSIRNVETTANIISGEFSKICKHLEFGIFTQVPTLVLSLVGHIEDFLRGFHGHIKVPGGGYANLKKLECRLENACVALNTAAKSMNESALAMSSSSESGARRSFNNGPPLPPRLSTSSSSSSTPISSPDCVPGSSNRNGSSDKGVIGDVHLALSSPSPFSSDPEQDSMDKQQYHIVVGEVVEGIVTVGNLFSQVVDLRLTRDLASILDTIEGGGIPARIALKSLATVLADGGNHICRLAADIRTVRGLLGVLLDTREDQDKILALRCLATVLCVGEAVKDFDKAGGFEIIADLLSDSVYSTWMKIEAVAVLTQATDPWIDLESTLVTLGVHLEKFIISLTKLIREFKTEEEPFLLIVAAISNLTFLEVASTEYLKRCRTVSFLIEAVHGGNANFSVFVLDHVATILANMAGADSCRQEIIQCGGIDALLQFLQQRPSMLGKTETVSAITACERLQQKSTIALSRLANEDGVARYVFDMGGVHRLVTLCRKEKERNYSDGVLIAALATLRKLVSVCGEDAVKGLGGAEDLIEPRLLDSFLLYSSRQESYV